MNQHQKIRIILIIIAVISWTGMFITIMVGQ